MGCWVLSCCVRVCLVGVPAGGAWCFCGCLVVSSLLCVLAGWVSVVFVAGAGCCPAAWGAGCVFAVVSVPAAEGR